MSNLCKDCFVRLGLMVFFTTLLLLAIPSYADAGKVCTDQEAIRANKIYGSVRRKYWTWDKLYKSFREYGHCADGKNNGIFAAELAYAYDDAVQHLLAEDWQHFSRFVEIDRHDKSFRSFVLLYIDEDMSRGEATEIVRNAKRHCPPNAKSLCQAVEAAVKAIPPASNWDTEHSW